jgi:hypothetical protein
MTCGLIYLFKCLFIRAPDLCSQLVPIEHIIISVSHEAISLKSVRDKWYNICLVRSTSAIHDSRVDLLSYFGPHVPGRCE